MGPRFRFSTWKDAEALYHVRSLVECEAVALCAMNISDEGIAQLRVALIVSAKRVRKGETLINGSRPRRNFTA